jgi:2-hydroxy-6-oxonona-2,4-dienedioate hydrolase
VIQFPISANGVLTRVLQAGREGTPLVFLHGMGARADRWHRNLDALALLGYRCFALDLPGHGLAEKGGHLRYDMQGLAAFVTGAMDQLGLERAVLVGTSLGGNIAAWIACHQPQRCLGLVLVGSLGLVPLPQANCERMAKTLADRSHEGVHAKFGRLLHNHTFITEDWIAEECRINGSPGAAQAFEQLAAYVVSPHGLNADNCGATLAAMDRRPPTLLVWGEEEKSVPLETGHRAHAMLPESEFLIIPAAAHMPYFEQNESFNQALAAFLARRTGQGGQG